MSNEGLLRRERAASTRGRPLLWPCTPHRMGQGPTRHEASLPVLEAKNGAKQPRFQYSAYKLHPPGQLFHGPDALP